MSVTYSYALSTHSRSRTNGCLHAVKTTMTCTQNMSCLLLALFHLCCLVSTVDAADGRAASLPTSFNDEDTPNKSKLLFINGIWSLANETLDSNSTESSPSHRYDPPAEIVLGYITGLSRNPESIYFPPGQLISGAITYAVEQINENTDILPNTTLKFVIADTHGEENESLYQTAEMIFKKIHAIIGPQESCVHEARLAAAYNVPMISYVSILFDFFDGHKIYVTVLV